MIWILLIFFCLTAACIPPASAQEIQKKEVLFLNSYHPGMVFSDEELKGVVDIFASQEESVDLRVEYMDTKRNSDEEYLSLLYKLYKEKYKNSPPDVIISADDSAFDFIRNHRDDLFPRVPVVFCGINYFSPDMIEGFDNITGVVEDKDIVNTLETAFSHFPDTERVVVIHDMTNTGIALRKQVEESVSGFEERHEFVYLSDMTAGELKENVSAQEGNTIILLEAFNRDSAGKVYTHEEIGDLVSSATDLPIYGNTEMFLDHGIIGGKITDGYSQGKAAGEMAILILAGEPASSIPVVTNGPNIYIFDYNKLEEFNIPITALPEGSYLINTPPKEEVPAWILYTALFFIGCMSVFIILLLIHIRVKREVESGLRENISRRKKAEKELLRGNEELNAAYEQLAANEEMLRRNYEDLIRTETELRESESRYRGVVEDQTEFICRFAPDKTILFANDAFCRYFGKDRNEITDHIIHFEIPSEERKQLSDHFASLTPSHPVAVIEHRIQLPGNETRWLQWTDRGVFDENGTLLEYQSVGRDITDRKNAEEALTQARKKLHILNSVAITDIKNVVFSLTGYLELEKEQATDENILIFLSKQEGLLEEIDNTLKFIQKYQDMGISPPQWQDVYLSLTFAISHIDFRRVSQLSRHFEVKGLEIYADPLFEEVLFILSENVIAHADTAKKISFSYSETSEGLTLVFEDDGPGIPDEMKEKIFERISGEKRGLGLFLSREILGITGISIKETGIYGNGARFEIFVPKGAYRFQDTEEDSMKDT